METEIKVLKSLIENKGGGTIREISKSVKIDYRIAHTAVERLFKKGLLERKKIGNSWQIKFSGKFSQEVFESEYQRKESVLKNTDIKIMLNSILENIGSRMFVLLLFGSYAKGKAAKNSDIDLMFIIQDKKMEDKIEDAIRILPLKIHLVIFTENDFIAMKKSKDVTVVSEAIKNNIILYGIEQYYGLLR